MVDRVIKLIQSGCPAFFKFIAANETGLTGGHQCGFYVSRDFRDLLFGQPCSRGENSKKKVRIAWNDDKLTESTLTYYGVKTRNESRITSFGRGFEFLKPEYIGSIVVFVVENKDSLRAFILESEEEIDDFLGALALGPADANRVINLDHETALDSEAVAFKKFIGTLKEDFPASERMSDAARSIEETLYDHAEYIVMKPDEKLISWCEIEYRLFRAIENDRYRNYIENGFSSVDEFIEASNTVLNRRKSRAGKSLEHHLSAIFRGNSLSFDEQVVTEGNKRPDFIFPSSSAYHDAAYPLQKMAFLAAKTTCKDRWRQILNEADRFKGETKYLCTLQQGMTEKQMNEMAAEKVVLVVPKPYIHCFPTKTSMRLISLSHFISHVKLAQS